MYDRNADRFIDTEISQDKLQASQRHKLLTFLYIQVSHGLPSLPTMHCKKGVSCIQPLKSQNRCASDSVYSAETLR